MEGAASGFFGAAGDAAGRGQRMVDGCALPPRCMGRAPNPMPEALCASLYKNCRAECSPFCKGLWTASAIMCGMVSNLRLVVCGLRVFVDAASRVDGQLVQFRAVLATGGQQMTHTTSGRRCGAVAILRDDLVGRVQVLCSLGMVLHDVHQHHVLKAKSISKVWPILPPLPLCTTRCSLVRSFPGVDARCALACASMACLRCCQHHRSKHHRGMHRKQSLVGLVSKASPCCARRCRSLRWSERCASSLPRCRGMRCPGRYHNKLAAALVIRFATQCTQGDWKGIDSPPTRTGGLMAG